MTTPICIPTIHRQNAALTLSSFTMREGLGPVCIVTREEERQFWLKQRDVDEVIVPQRSGIAFARQAVIDWAIDAGHEKVLMLDDDLYFYTRYKEGSTDLRKSLPGEISNALLVLSSALDTYAHVTMGPRQFQQAKPNPAYENVRANNVHGYRPQVLREHGIRFADMECMEDYHVTLSLMECGFPNYGYWGVVWNQKQSGGAGGCSTYRDAAMQERSAKRLEALHPKTVKAVIKRSETGRGAMGTRWDVSVRWKDALVKR
ncbi:MAG: hypothetical protein E6Q97_06555 [Desulfurellales bacterium]|nr:MAG: hypothetical protein E6Q97_06555 [Desulfurellales bacterium]